VGSERPRQRELEELQLQPQEVDEIGAPQPPVRILLLLTWYTPHISGLTIAAGRIATGLRALGHRVTVLTSQHSRDLPLEETLDGVRVVRTPVAGRLSKGVIAPGYLGAAARLSKNHDAVIAFLPAGPAECLASILAARRCPLIVEYICDIRLPGGLFDRLIERVIGAFLSLVARAASAIVISSGDYARSSPFLTRYPDKVRIAGLPIRMSQPRPAEVAQFRSYGAPNGPVIGMAARLAADKGFELLLEALPLIRVRFPDARVLCAGNYQTVVGEDRYRRDILPRIESLGEQWQMLGIVQPDLSSFFAACDVLVLPSLNRTESFGMVQAEAMLCGTPVVASDSPGIRVAIQATGMGRLFRPGDVRALAGAIIFVLENRQSLIRPPEEVQRIFSEEAALDERLQIIRELLAERSAT
jgi:glycosyltransferase involved in cell wall biosynthesis